MMSRWTIPMDRLAQRYGKRLEDVVRQTTLQLFQAIDERSPVDTGRFRGNWQVSYGSPLSSPIERLAPGGAGEPSKALSLPVGGTVYMSNALPYAQRLEYGWSKQAPLGMVRRTVAEFNEYVKRALR